MYSPQFHRYLTVEPERPSVGSYFLQEQGLYFLAGCTKIWWPWLLAGMEGFWGREPSWCEAAASGEVFARLYARRGCSPLARRSCFCWPRKFRGIWECKVWGSPIKWPCDGSQLCLGKLLTRLGGVQEVPDGVLLHGVRESPSQVRCEDLLVGSSGCSCWLTGGVQGIRKCCTRCVQNKGSPWDFIYRVRSEKSFILTQNFLCDRYILRAHKRQSAALQCLIPQKLDWIWKKLYWTRV